MLHLLLCPEDGCVHRPDGERVVEQLQAAPLVRPVRALVLAVAPGAPRHAAAPQLTAQRPGPALALGGRLVLGLGAVGVAVTQLHPRDTPAQGCDGQRESKRVNFT